jgi:two-component sensor histidine kinase
VALGVALLVALAGLFVAYDYQQELTRRQQQLTSLSRLILEHGERAIEDGDKVLKAISGPLIGWDQRDEAQARHIFESIRQLMQGSPQVSSVWICSADGVTILESWGFPSRAASCANREYFRERLQGVEGPRLQGLEQGSITSKPRFTLTRDVRNPDGTLKAVAVVGIYSDYFAELYAAVFTEASMRGGLFLDVDTTDFSLLARLGSSPRASTTYTRLVLAQLRDKPFGSDILTDGNESRIGAWQRSKIYPTLFASTSIDLNVALSDWRKKAVIFSAIALGCGLAFIGLSVFARRAFEAQTELRHQELIQREVYHRVKNNLQILAALASRSPEDGSAKSLQLHLLGNIAAIGKVFDLLQLGSKPEQVNLSELLRALADQIWKATDTKVVVECDDDHWVGAARATNLAIATNELVTNAVKHAHSEVRILCSQTASRLNITVCDDGPGVVPSADPDRRSFGLKLVRTLAGEEGGKLSLVDTGDGGAAEITVPVL